MNADTSVLAYCLHGCSLGGEKMSLTEPLLQAGRSQATHNTVRTKGSLRASIREAELSTPRAGGKLPSALLSLGSCWKEG